MCDRREHRRTKLVGFGVELREPRSRVEPRAVERDGRLTRRGLEQLVFTPCERPGAHRTLRRQRAERHRRDQHGQRLGRASRLDALAARARAHLLAVQRDLDAARREREGLKQHRHELVEDAVGQVAGQELARQQREQPRLALPFAGAPSFRGRVADDEPYHGRDREEDDGRDDVAQLLEGEAAFLPGEVDESQRQRREQRGEDAGPDPARHGGDGDREHEDRDHGTRAEVARQQRERGAAGRGEHADRHRGSGDPVFDPGVEAVAHAHTLPRPQAARATGISSRILHGVATILHAALTRLPRR
jgi:hypothetical protein